MEPLGRGGARRVETVRLEGAERKRKGRGALPRIRVRVDAAEGADEQVEPSADPLALRLPRVLRGRDGAAQLALRERASEYEQLLCELRGRDQHEHPHLARRALGLFPRPQPVDERREVGQRLTRAARLRQNDALEL